MQEKGDVSVRTVSFPELYAMFAETLNLIEDRLESLLEGDHPLFFEGTVHLLRAGGKRLRPLLALIAARVGESSARERGGGVHAGETPEERERRLVHLGVSLELVHMASLVHDDVVDAADLRRGRATVRARWGEGAAVLLGDMLFAKALEEISSIGDRLAAEILARAVYEMSVGEIVQLGDLYRPVTCREYLRRIRRKTALLIAASARLGARIGGAPPDVERRVGLFGHYAGMAFQLTDDLLDFVGTEEELGKPRGHDLAQGHVTLPTLLALRDPMLGPEVRAALRARRTAELLPELVARMHERGIFEESRAFVARYVTKGEEALAPLRDLEGVSYLEGVLHFIARRKY